MYGHFTFSGDTCTYNIVHNFHLNMLLQRYLHFTSLVYRLVGLGV